MMTSHSPPFDAGVVEAMVRDDWKKRGYCTGTYVDLLMRLLEVR